MANDTFFSGVLSLGNIPKQNLVRITTATENSRAIAVTPDGKNEVPLIYDEDTFSIRAKSSFNSIGNPKSNSLMTILSSATSGKIPSGQFALQSVQIWESTDPLEFSLSVSLYMRDDGYDDVVFPIKQLMKLCLPELKKNGLSQTLGLLIPPGPSFKEILSLSFTESKEENDILNIEGSLVNVSVGKFYFTNCIVTNVEPDFSSVVDENGYPSSASVTIDFRTCMVATRDMIDKMITKSK